MSGPDMDYEYEDELNESIYVYKNTNKRELTKELTVTFSYPEEMTEQEITDNIHNVIENAGIFKKFIGYSFDILEVWEPDNGKDLIN